jgi:hypothetical protein
LRAILLKTARGEYAPRRLRVYANFPNIIDFSDAEGTRPHLDISLLEETSVTEYPLRVAAFANVSSLSLFFVRPPIFLSLVFLSLSKDMHFVNSNYRVMP